jgi:hypothetical protein
VEAFKKNIDEDVKAKCNYYSKMFCENQNIE